MTVKYEGDIDIVTSGTLTLQTQSDPVSPVDGEVWYSGGDLKFHDGTSSPEVTKTVVVGINVGAGEASLNLPVLTANPSTPEEGDVWLVNSGGGANYYLRAYINGGVRTVELT